MRLLDFMHRVIRACGIVLSRASLILIPMLFATTFALLGGFAIGAVPLHTMIVLTRAFVVVTVIVTVTLLVSCRRRAKPLDARTIRFPLRTSGEPGTTEQIRGAQRCGFCNYGFHMLQLSWHWRETQVCRKRAELAPATSASTEARPGTQLFMPSNVTYNRKRTALFRQEAS